MRKSPFAGVCFTLILLLAIVAYAQPSDDVWGSKGQYCRMYDPNTVETVNGVVTAVRQFNPPGPGAGGLRFTLTTAKGPIEVILGPGWFVDTQDFKMLPHDKVTVKGSRVAVEGHPTIIAAEVSKSEKTWKIRHHSGMPVWIPKSGLEGTG